MREFLKFLSVKRDGDPGASIRNAISALYDDGTPLDEGGLIVSRDGSWFEELEPELPRKKYFHSCGKIKVLVRIYDGEASSADDSIPVPLAERVEILPKLKPVPDAVSHRTWNTAGRGITRDSLVLNDLTRQLRPRTRRIEAALAWAAGLIAAKLDRFEVRSLGLLWPGASLSDVDPADPKADLTKFERRLRSVRWTSCRVLADRPAAANVDPEFERDAMIAAETAFDRSRGKAGRNSAPEFHDAFQRVFGFLRKNRVDADLAKGYVEALRRVSPGLRDRINPKDPCSKTGIDELLEDLGRLGDGLTARIAADGATLKNLALFLDREALDEEQLRVADALLVDAGLDPDNLVEGQVKYNPQTLRLNREDEPDDPDAVSGNLGDWLDEVTETVEKERRSRDAEREELRAARATGDPRRPILTMNNVIKPVPTSLGEENGIKDAERVRVWDVLFTVKDGPKSETLSAVEFARRFGANFHVTSDVAKKAKLTEAATRRFDLVRAVEIGIGSRAQVRRRVDSELPWRLFPNVVDVRVAPKFVLTGTCPECGLVQPDLPRHFFKAHGRALPKEVETARRPATVCRTVPGRVERSVYWELRCPHCGDILPRGVVPFDLEEADDETIFGLRSLPDGYATRISDPNNCLKDGRPRKLTAGEAKAFIALRIWEKAVETDPDGDVPDAVMKDLRGAFDLLIDGAAASKTCFRCGTEGMVYAKVGETSEDGSFWPAFVTILDQRPKEFLPIMGGDGTAVAGFEDGFGDESLLGGYAEGVDGVWAVFRPDWMASHQPAARFLERNIRKAEDVTAANAAKIRAEIEREFPDWASRKFLNSMLNSEIRERLVAAAASDSAVTPQVFALMGRATCADFHALKRAVAPLLFAPGSATSPVRDLGWALVKARFDTLHERALAAYANGPVFDALRDDLRSANFHELETMPERVTACAEIGAAETFLLREEYVHRRDELKAKARLDAVAEAAVRTLENPAATEAELLDVRALGIMMGPEGTNLRRAAERRLVGRR